MPQSIGSCLGGLYLVGAFDGCRFTPFSDTPQIVDFEPDFYASASGNGMPDAQASPIWIGWTSNHTSGCQYPTFPWRGEMSTPRELGLQSGPGGLRLAQRPIEALDLMFEPSRAAADMDCAAGHRLDLDAGRDEAVCRLKFTLDPDSRNVSIVLNAATGGSVEISIDAAAGLASIDRSAWSLPKHQDFPARHEGVFSAAWPVDIDLLIDATSVELFAWGGTCAITSRCFQTGPRSLSLECPADTTLFRFQVDRFRTDV